MTADMASEAYPSQPILLNVEPTLFVTDFQRSLAFFTEQLGFRWCGTRPYRISGSSTSP